jgi:hypothetical protein
MRPVFTLRTQKRHVRRMAARLVAIAAVWAVGLATWASTASAGTDVWLPQWTNTAAQAIWWDGWLSDVLYVKTRPEAQAYGCANLYGTQYQNDYYFSTYWICSVPGSGYQSPLINDSGQPAAYNDSSYPQGLWAWVDFN